MVTQSNSPARTPVEFLEDKCLVDEVAVQGNEVCLFEAHKQRFRAIFSYWHRLGGIHDDFNDADALRDGFQQLWRLVAVDEDGCPHAVWEVYYESDQRLRSKAIDVDHRKKGQGIGTAFLYAVRQHLPIEWSGTYTEEGARLKDRVERLEAGNSERP